MRGAAIFLTEFRERVLHDEQTKFGLDKSGLRGKPNLLMERGINSDIAQ